MKHTTPALRDALQHAEHDGWHYLPVQGARRPHQAKQPACRHWPTESTCDASTVASWASQGYGLAIDCGKSGLVVLDADQPQAAAHLNLADAWIISGNPRRCSYIYNQPPSQPPIGCATAGWPAGEVKGVGGYVVVPPSYHPVGGTYRWISRQGSRVMPDSILQLLRLPERATPLQHINPPTPGPMCKQLTNALRRHTVILLHSTTTPRHDAARNAVLHLMRLGAAGHQGSAIALEQLRLTYLFSCADDTQRQHKAQVDYMRLLEQTPRYLATLTIQPVTCTGPLCGTLSHAPSPLT